MDAHARAAQALVRATPRVEAKPLTEEQIGNINRRTEWPNGSLRNLGEREWMRLLTAAARAIEHAHGIGTQPEGDAR
jgi:hypothetical protein